MANEVLRSKLSLTKLSEFFSIICGKYTDVSNKEQLYDGLTKTFVQWKAFLAATSFQTSKTIPL